MVAAGQSTRVLFAMFILVLFPDLVGNLRLLFALFGDLVIVFLAYTAPSFEATPIAPPAASTV